MKGIRARAEPGSNPRPKAPEGFTLLELLVATVMFALLIAVLFGMVDSVTKLWRASENRAESYREARAALNLIASDLRSAFVSTNTNYFSTNITPAFDASSGDSALFFISVLPSGAQAEGSSLGDLCQVGYYLKYGSNGAGAEQRGSYSLYRFFKESNETFTDLTRNDPLFHHSSTNVELLARNIPFFKIRYYTVRSDGFIVSWTRSTNTPLPNFLELELTAYNNDAVRRLDGSSAWKNTNSRIFRENSRVFTLRVPVRQPF